MNEMKKEQTKLTDEQRERLVNSLIDVGNVIAEKLNEVTDDLLEITEE